SFFVRPGSRFFVPTCAGEAAAGADRVKGGRGAGLSTRAVLWRPSLDAVEHAARLDAVGLESSAPSPSELANRCGPRDTLKLLSGYSWRWTRALTKCGRRPHESPHFQPPRENLWALSPRLWFDFCICC